MITLYNENDVRIRDLEIYELNDTDMGESTVTATVKFDTVMQFHPDWYVLVDGEKYKLGVTEPSGKKTTANIDTEYTLTFHSSREDLKRYTFMDFVEYGSDNPQPSQHTFSIQSCTLQQFVSRFNVNLQYYLGSLWQMTLSQDADPDIKADLSFDKASLWDVLLTVYQNYGVRWTIHSNVYGNMVITVGQSATILQTILEYGAGNGLISVERTNPMERIVTRLRGKGGERNLPANYFHGATTAFPIADPDTNSVLQNIFYTKLYPKTYRDYVRGYNSGEPDTEESWAYNKGAADKVAGKPMNIVDYVKSDKEGLWGVSYGAIEDNESIYPTLQGAKRNGVELDKVLKVSEIYVDAPEDDKTYHRFTQVVGAEGSFQGRDYYLYDHGDGGIAEVVGIENAKTASAESEPFTLDSSINTIRTKLLATPTKVADFYASKNGITEPDTPELTTIAAMSTHNWVLNEKIQLINANDTVVRTWEDVNQDFFDVSAEDIPAGTYRFRIYLQWYKSTSAAPDKLLYTIDWQLYGCEFASYSAQTEKLSFSETFDIWIGNVWNTSKQSGESDEDYACRVWAPLVSTQDLTVMFSDGLLAGEDYEFIIAGAVADADDINQIIKNAIHYDTSVTGSHWRLSLLKTDAELDASGKYLPNSVVNAVEGNHFFFVNIQMPYDPYVYDAERRLQEYLETELALLDTELPTFAVTPSSVFINSFSEADSIRPGNRVKLRNESLIGSTYTTVYIQSVTKRYTDKKINPDWSIVVSDQIIVNGNPITLIEGKIKTLSNQIYSGKQSTRDSIEILSQMYLRKDGVSDTSFSPTDFRAPLTIRDRFTDYGFREGYIGGKGFGVYTDADGNRVIEADVLVGRMSLKVNEILVAQVEYVGGQKLYSAAAMTVSKVEDMSGKWRCYFDSKQGSVRNMFLVGDMAFCQRFKGTETGGYTTYWAKVVAIGSDYVELSKTDMMTGSSGTPSVGDNIIQLGNASDVDRQSAILMSSYGNNSPSIRLYHGISGYTLIDKDIFGVEYDAEKGFPYFFNYGSMRLGARPVTDPDEEDTGNYIEYDHLTGKMKVKAEVEFLPTSTGLEQLAAFQKLVEIANGNIQNWFYDNAPDGPQEGPPTSDNYPASDWLREEEEETIDERPNHVGDIYYSDEGQGYRYKQTGLGGYEWQLMENSELSYLTSALHQTTLVSGGLILTSTIVLGYRDSEDVYHVQAGINGNIEASSIAAWYGGSMVDRFRYNSGTTPKYEEITPVPTGAAASLFRFDGSGYLANGKINWDASGNSKIAAFIITNTGLSNDYTAANATLEVGNNTTRFARLNFSNQAVITARNDGGQCVAATAFGSAGIAIYALSNQGGKALDSYGNVALSLRSGEDATIVRDYGGSSAVAEHILSSPTAKKIVKSTTEPAAGTSDEIITIVI